jgi:hypothetical protein
MTETAAWFFGWATLSVVCALGGVRAGRQSDVAGRVLLALGVCWLVGWAWLVRDPSLGVRVVPVSVLSRIEGVGSVPAFALVLGVAWAWSRRTRQRAIVCWAGGLGAVYFLSGGLWLLQETPASVMGQTPADGPVMQSQDYSCVAAASATALSLVGIHASEAEMAELAQVRPGTGATLVRALDGLNRKLEGTPYQAELLRLSIPELKRAPLPAITAVELEVGRRHMITIELMGNRYIRIHDPVDGTLNIDYYTLSRWYRGEAIVLVPRGRW